MVDWSSISRQHGPLVWRTIYRVLGADADVADCFQETFICALEVASRQAIRNWPGLLQRLATARALDALRRKRRQRNRISQDVMRDWGDVPSAGPSSDPTQHAQDAELMDRLR